MCAASGREVGGGWWLPLRERPFTPVLPSLPHLSPLYPSSRTASCAPSPSTRSTPQPSRCTAARCCPTTLKRRRGGRRSRRRCKSRWTRHAGGKGGLECVGGLGLCQVARMQASKCSWHTVWVRSLAGRVPAQPHHHPAACSLPWVTSCRFPPLPPPSSSPQPGQAGAGAGGDQPRQPHGPGAGAGEPGGAGSLLQAGGWAAAWAAAGGGRVGGDLRCWLLPMV